MRFPKCHYRQKDGQTLQPEASNDCCPELTTKSTSVTTNYGHQAKRRRSVPKRRILGPLQSQVLAPKQYLSKDCKVFNDKIPKITFVQHFQRFRKVSAVCKSSKGNNKSRSETRRFRDVLKNKTWNSVTTQSGIKRTKEDNLMQRRSSLSAHSTTPIAPPTS
ncbi:uncharacterized protein TNCV_1652061 [Trichonephila clavipes]|nr:uncharacterized protein TNCV_1652061 [Trichonephila clavipes]